MENHICFSKFFFFQPKAQNLATGLTVLIQKHIGEKYIAKTHMYIKQHFREYVDRCSTTFSNFLLKRHFVYNRLPAIKFGSVKKLK